MKTKTLIVRIAMATLAGVLVVSLTGCGGVDTSMSDRINAFVGAINSDNYPAIRSLCDSGARDYATSATTDYWDDYFTPGNDYEVSGISESGTTATATITGAPEYTSGVLFTFTFTEDEGGMFEGSTFFIRTISYEGRSTPIFQ